MCRFPISFSVMGNVLSVWFICQFPADSKSYVPGVSRKSEIRDWWLLKALRKDQETKVGWVLKNPEISSLMSTETLSF